MKDVFVLFYIEHRLEVIKRQLRMTTDPVQRAFFNDRHTAHLKLRQKFPTELFPVEERFSVRAVVK